MDVRAVFDLPVPVWVMRDALDEVYPSGFGQTTFTVVMPSTETTFNEPAGGDFDSRPELNDTEWAAEYGAFIPESLKPATALLRVGITDVDGPIPAHNTWFDPPHQLAEYITPWFDRVRTWAEVITGQDLDPNHRVYDAVAVGAGLTFIEPAHDSPLGMQLGVSRVRPLRASEWQRILELARDGVEPPLEEVLSRDARAAQRRGADRRAIIEAATAVEVVLSRHLHRHADRLTDGQRASLQAGKTTLGAQVMYAAQAGIELAVPVEALREFNQLRNDAAHRGQTPRDGWQTSRAVQLMIDFLGAHGTYARLGDDEPDGSEWVPLDNDNEIRTAPGDH